MTTRVPVLICGGGLAGLTAALLLHREGVHPMLVEKHPGTSVHPKARRFNPRSTEIFRLLGLGDDVARAAAALAGFEGTLVGRSMADAQRQQLPPATAAKIARFETFVESGPGPNVLVPQNVLEPLLRRAGEQRGVSLRFGTELVSFRQDEKGVTARLCPAGGEPYEVTADYLIAADGAHSPIRAATGIARSGPGRLADNLDLHFRADLTELAREKPFLFCQITDPVTPGAFAAINGSDRWLYSLSDFPDASTVTDDRWRELLSRLIGVPGIEVELLSRLHWEAAMRVADRFRAGRVFLVGDAAHVMPPTAAAGANTAIGDATNLAWKLAAVLNGRAGTALLDTYHRERHPVGHATAERSSTVVGNLADMVMAMMQGRGLPGDQVATLFGNQYPQGALVPDGRDPAPTDHYEPAGRPGTRVPHAWLDTDTSTIDLAGPGLTLLSGPDDHRWSTETARLALRHVRVSDPAWLTAAALPDDGALLLRPDAIIAWHSASPTPLAEALNHVLARSTTNPQR
jgi:putative polyketide hydroxylase